MEVEETVKKLKDMGYRISKPKPKEEFKPYEAIHMAFGEPSKVIVIREMRKTVEIQTENGYKFKVKKNEIYEFNQQILDLCEELREKKRELSRQEGKLSSEMWEKIDGLSKRRFQEK